MSNGKRKRERESKYLNKSLNSFYLRYEKKEEAQKNMMRIRPQNYNNKNLMLWR